MKKIFFNLCKTVLCIFCACVLVIAGINIYMINSVKKYVYTDINDVPQKYCAIILGARVYENNTVSFVFRDRIDAGMELLNMGTVKKVLISGDHGRKKYDEVNSALKYINIMYDYNSEDIFLDHAGFSTYETMYRAKNVFCVEQTIVVTQKFHVYRSLYIARKLGIDALGYICPAKNDYSKRTVVSWNIREVLARVKSFFLVMFDVPPTYLGEKIPVTGSGLYTRDE